MAEFYLSKRLGDALAKLADIVGLGEIASDFMLLTSQRKQPSVTDITGKINTIADKIGKADKDLRDRLTNELSGLVNALPIGRIQRDLLTKKIQKQQEDLRNVEKRIITRDEMVNDIKNEALNDYNMKSKYGKSAFTDNIVNKASEQLKQVEKTINLQNVENKV